MPLPESTLNKLNRIFDFLHLREGQEEVVSRLLAGKSVLAISQLLTWPHSVVVVDIKGELYQNTAGYRATLGKVFCIDPEGFGHRGGVYAVAFSPDGSKLVTGGKTISANAVGPAAIRPHSRYRGMAANSAVRTMIRRATSRVSAGSASSGCRRK